MTLLVHIELTIGLNNILQKVFAENEMYKWLYRPIPPIR